MCDCHLAKVTLAQLPGCVLLSVCGILEDIFRGEVLHAETYFRDDRIYYVLLLVVLFLALRLFLLRRIQQQPHKPWRLGGLGYTQDFEHALLPRP